MTFYPGSLISFAFTKWFQIEPASTPKDKGIFLMKFFLWLLECLLSNRLNEVIDYCHAKFLYFVKVPRICEVLSGH